MYKDDNFITREGCSEALLRMMTDGRGNTPLSEGARQKPSCDGSDRSSSASFGLHGYPLGSVYAPLQSFEELYDLDTAHKQGSLTLTSTEEDLREEDGCSEQPYEQIQKR